MKKLSIVLVVLFACGGVYFLLANPGTVHPAIKNFGPVFEVPFTEGKPDASLNYKIVVDCGIAAGKPLENPGEMYAPLQHVARMYNLHVYGGVKPEKLHVAVAIWGDPISIVMNNETYYKKYGADNPNLKILNELKLAGVTIYACGQSLAKNGIDAADICSEATPVLSRFTAVSTLQLSGFAYFRFD